MHMTTLLSIEHWIIGKNLAMCGTFHNRRTVPHCLPARRCCQHPPKPQDAHNGDKLRMGHVFICYFTLYRQAHLIILPTKGFSTALYLCWLSIDALVLFKRAKQGELLDKLAWGGKHAWCPPSDQGPFYDDESPFKVRSASQPLCTVKSPDQVASLQFAWYVFEMQFEPRHH